VVLIRHKTRELLANNIVFFRHKCGWSQEDLAYHLKSSPAYISQLENAKRNVTSDFIDKLANIFKVEHYELLVKRERVNSKRIDQRK